MKIEKQKLDVKEIINAGQKVYLGYLLLDMINDEKIIILLYWSFIATLCTQLGLSVTVYEKRQEFSCSVNIKVF